MNFKKKTTVSTKFNETPQKTDCRTRVLFREMQLRSERTLTMLVGVVALRYQRPQWLITECHNSHKHSHSPSTSSFSTFSAYLRIINEILS